MSSKSCEGSECYEIIYDAKLINLHEFRITRLFSPGKEVPPGCTTPTEDETNELVGKLENYVVKNLEREESSFIQCPQGCECIFNGRFSEWSEWRDYSEDQIEVVAHTSRENKKIVCEWKVRGFVKVRYKKRLGDCFRKKLF